MPETETAIVDLQVAIRYLRAKALWWSLGNGWGWGDIMRELNAVADALEGKGDMDYLLWEEDYAKERRWREEHGDAE